MEGKSRMICRQDCHPSLLYITNRHNENISWNTSSIKTTSRHSSLPFKREYAGIFLHERYLFREGNSFPRNRELSEHTFPPNGSHRDCHSTKILCNAGDKTLSKSFPFTCTTWNVEFSVGLLFRNTSWKLPLLTFKSQGSFLDARFSTLGISLYKYHRIFPSFLEIHLITSEKKRSRRMVCMK